MDILVNNAGMPVQTGAQLTRDGLDIVIQTNYLAHFLLTNLLKVGHNQLTRDGLDIVIQTNYLPHLAHVLVKCTL